MPEIAFSIGKHARHADGLEQVRGTFDDLAQRVQPNGHAEKDGPYICGPLRGGRRNTESAEPIAFVALDLDRIADDVALSAIVEAADRWQGIGYTTFSHKPEAGINKARLIFALDREVTRAEYPRLCRAVAAGLAYLAHVPVEIDASCSKPEQPLYTARSGAAVWRFDGEAIRVDQALLSVPDEPERASPLAGLKSSDPILVALRDQGRILRDMGAGKFAIRCPFEADHSREHTADDSSTVYLLPHTNGYQRGHFRCQHDHCTGRPDAEFLAALGLGNRGGQTSTTVSASEDVVTPEFSDNHLALEFVAQYGAGLRWSPGLDWMRDAGTHWTRDDHLIRFNAARLTCRSAANAADAKVQARLASAKTVAAVLSLAQSDPRIVVPSEEWDRDPFMLNTPAGIVDLRTGNLRTRNRVDYLTQITAVSPDAAMRCPNWLRFVGEVFAHDADVIEFVQRMGGYILTGDRREQKLFFAYGVGANGKSTLLDLWLWLMGTYALKLPTTALMLSKVERHPTELAQLRGKRLAMSNELEEGAFWAESRIKELTGDDTLTARFMRQDNFEFRQSQKHLIAGNHKPRLRGGDPAIARRMVLIPFLEVFDGHRKDKTLPEKLRAEAPAVLAWLIEGARKWYADGLVIPATVQAASRDYLAEHDDAAMWIEECCETGAALTDSASELYASFRLWKRDRGEAEPSLTVWGQRMALVQGIRKRRSGGIKYDGIRLTIDAREALLNRRGG
ncbi:MAG: phage/plasmid primase, P4 family [Burkholderiaceae bacterium]|nr:phage/plasmid primase, P4 family [Burkholderiaceae bacterium]